MEYSTYSVVESRQDISEDLVKAAIEFEREWLRNMPGYKKLEEERKQEMSVLTIEDIRTAWWRRTGEWVTLKDEVPHEFKWTLKLKEPLLFFNYNLS